MSAQTPITLLHVVSFAFLAVVLVSDYDIACMAPRLTEVIQIVQFYFSDSPPAYSRHSQPYSSTSFSPSAKVLEGGTCESPPPFPTEPPISRPHTMALLAESKRVAAEFKLTDDDVRRVAAEFVNELGALESNVYAVYAQADNHTEEGLAKNATNMSQIPTYVTGVPNGTEKVSRHAVVLRRTLN